MSNKSPQNHIYNSTCECDGCMATKRHFGGFDTVWRDWDYTPDSPDSSSVESYDVDSDRLKQIYLAQPLQSSEQTDTENTTTNITQAENIQFRDGGLSERIDMGTLSSGDYDADNDSLAGLSSFLSRPVRIANIQWPESTFTQTSILPWSLYFNDANIKNKLQNFARIRCRLHLKFVLNASPFYYGSLRACYFPLADQRGNYINAVDQVPFSQVPGVYLEPQNMTTAEMTLPFLWPYNWLDATSIANFNAMGTLQFLQYANLRSANGVVGSGVNVSVYAWAEDVQLMGPTTSAALQSDEYEDTEGPISGPATAVASVAGKLADVPVIGQFAKATEMGATAVASIARMFGYSNPPVIDDVRGFQNKTFHAFANTETRMPIDKLALDPKNEVTISSEVAGVSQEDPLAFNKLLTHESFMLGTLWAGADAVDKLLWSAQINPGYLFLGGGYYTSVPMAHFSRMFRYWRGSLIFKFRIIKTKYHKGRLLISWDPTQGNVTNADTETTTLTRVVDIEYEDEVEFEVPYKAISPYLNCLWTNGMVSNGTSPSYTTPARSINGAITVRVQNVLTGPAASPQIDILGYVRAGDDFVFAVPNDNPPNISINDPAGVIQSEEIDDGVAIDGNKHSVDSEIAMITTGEAIASLRPYLHRTILSTSQYLGNPSGTIVPSIYTTVNSYYRVPRGMGRDGGGYQNANIATVSVPYSYSTNHPIDWTLNCFVGFRGSTNIHFNVNNAGTNPVTSLGVERYYSTVTSNNTGNRNGTSAALVNSTVGLPAFNSLQNFGGKNRQPVGFTGMSLTNQQGQPALSVNVPQYSNSRFTLAWKSRRDTDPITADFIGDSVVLATKFRIDDAAATFGISTKWPIVDVYYSAGVDFQPIFFLCTPRTFSTNPPTLFD